jgi:quinoprotein glucose dehydrogenase
VTFAPDGKLYILDWVDGWPKSNKGRVYGISPANPDPAQVRISADLAKLLNEGFSQRGAPELSALLSHPDRRARLEAQLELASRGNASVKIFTAVANNKSAAPLARLHAVWGLTQLGHKNAPVGPTLLKLLADADGEVRAQSAKGLGDIRFAKAQATLVKKLTDAEPRVQFFAAQSLGKLRDAKSTESLLALLRTNDNKDPYLRHAAAHALASIGKNAALDAGVRDPSAAVRLGVVLAYRKLGDANVAWFLDDSDAFVAREAAIAINDAPVTDAFSALAGKLDSAPVADEAFVERAINATYRLGTTAHAKALAQYATRDAASESMRAEALLQLGLWGTTPQRDRIVGIFRPLAARDGKPAAEALTDVLPRVLGKGPEAVQLAALEAVGNLQLRTAAPTLLATVANNQAPAAVRVGALKTLDAFGGDDVMRAIDAVEKSSAETLRLAALQVVARRAPERALPIVRRLSTDGSQAEQQAAFQALGQLKTADTPRLLVAALDQLAAGKIRPGAQLELIESAEASDAPAVKARWAKQQAAWAASGDPLAPYSFALVGGAPGPGARQFFGNPVMPCARCHKVGGEGGEAGPDLSLIGAQKKKEYLLEAIIKPSAHIAAGFDVVTLQLKSGATETGSIASETPTEIVLKRADNTTTTIAPQQVKERVTAPSSMPEIYAQVMTRAQLRDLMAFLGELTRSGQPDGEVPFGQSNRAMSSTAQETKAGGHR